MIDREKVIEAVEDAFNIVCDDYIGMAGFNLDDWMQKKQDALELLKEHEPVEPKTENDGAPADIACWWYVCGSCGCTIDPGDDYCRHCGRAVNWDETTA